MESQNRNVWIVVAVALLVLCCCAMSVVAVLGGMVFAVPNVLREVPVVSWEMAGQEGEQIQRTFDVGRAPELKIDNFAGSVTVRAGEGDEIQVIATKRVRSNRDLERIEVDMQERENGLHIRTQKPSSLHNVSVELAITAPADTRLDLSTGAGNVEIRGLGGYVKAHTGSGSIAARELSGGAELDTGSGNVTVQSLRGDVEADSGSGRVLMEAVEGDIDAHTGSGSMDVEGATGQVRLDTGSGSISYRGEPVGDCRFKTGSGSISLVLPRDLDMEVDLDTGSGSIRVDYEVSGKITRTEVQGVVGAGSQGSLTAHTGSGTIQLIRR